ncbi:MAG: hypothetical protein ACREC5_06340 [Thermoplasmata archaeon]
MGQVRDRTFAYQRRSPRRRDWSAYDRAQTRELEEILSLIGLVVDTAAAERSPMAPLPRSGGRPKVPRYELLKGLLWQSLVLVDNRRAEGEIRFFGIG